MIVNYKYLYSDYENLVVDITSVFIDATSTHYWWEYMTPDVNVYRTATLLIREHGSYAARAAEQQADRFLDSDDWDRHRVWRRVVAAVQELQRTAPPMSLQHH